jgi:hypothetical protein
MPLAINLPLVFMHFIVFMGIRTAQEQGIVELDADRYPVHRDQFCRRRWRLIAASLDRSAAFRWTVRRGQYAASCCPSGV